MPGVTMPPGRSKVWYHAVPSTLAWRSAGGVGVPVEGLVTAIGATLDGVANRADRRRAVGRPCSTVPVGTAAGDVDVPRLHGVDQPGDVERFGGGEAGRDQPTPK